MIPIPSREPGVPTVAEIRARERRRVELKSQGLSDKEVWAVIRSETDQTPRYLGPWWEEVEETWSGLWSSRWRTTFMNWHRDRGMTLVAAEKAAYEFIRATVPQDQLLDPAKVAKKRQAEWGDAPSVIPFDPTVRRSRRPKPAGIPAAATLALRQG